MSKRIIYSCVTLKKELENVITATGFDGEVHFLSEKLHSSPQTMLMYGKEASNRKQEIDRQHYTIPNQRPKDKHCGKI